jgi:hypothetical protein
LDIILVHYHADNLEDTFRWWSDFLELEKAKEVDPYVYFYCQNSAITDLSILDPLLKNGEVVHLDNVGREGHAYLHHITNNYDKLADHTLFSQAIPEDIMKDRFQHLFEPKTGALPLGLVGHVDCDFEWLPKDQMPQLHAMLTRTLCPPEGFTGFFMGEFLVSRQRIHAQDIQMYTYLQELLSAPMDHWVHSMHNNPAFKDPSNSFFGHTLERAWSLAFNCAEWWREANCWRCEQQGFEGCGTDDCQCFD